MLYLYYFFLLFFKVNLKYKIFFKNLYARLTLTVTLSGFKICNATTLIIQNWRFVPSFVEISASYQNSSTPFLRNEFFKIFEDLFTMT